MTRPKIRRRDATEIVRSRYPDRTRCYATVTSTQPRSPLQTINSQTGKHIPSNEAIDWEDQMEAEQRGSKRTIIQCNTQEISTYKLDLL